MSIAKLLFCGPADMYADTAQRNYNIFMESTEKDKERVADERRAVSEAFGRVCGSYMGVGIVRGCGEAFSENTTTFDEVLSRALKSCHAKGVKAEDENTTFFKMAYPRRKHKT